MGDFRVCKFFQDAEFRLGTELEREWTLGFSENEACLPGSVPHGLFKGGFMTKSFFCLLGLVLVIEGIPYFAFPDKMKKLMSMVQEVPDVRLRPIGFLVMCAGLLIAYVFRA